MESGVGCEVTVMLRPRKAVFWLCDESIASTVKTKVPVTVGVPLTMPVVVERPNPGGIVPPTIFHEYGAVPPLTLNPELYADCNAPFGRLDVVT